MEKIRILILLITMLCLLYSCGIKKTNLQDNKESSAQEESYSNNINTMVQFHVGDVPRWTTEIINTNPEKEKTIVFEGSERKLTYDRTIEQEYSIYSIDYYTEKDTGYTFNIKKKNIIHI
jgi:hypothetical protein